MTKKIAARTIKQTDTRKKLALNKETLKDLSAKGDQHIKGGRPRNCTDASSGC